MEVQVLSWAPSHPDPLVGPTTSTVTRQLTILGSSVDVTSTNLPRNYLTYKKTIAFLMLCLIVVATGVLAQERSSQVAPRKPSAPAPAWNMNKNIMPVFVASTWSDDSVHFLSPGLDNVASFPVGSTSPNGIATDGTLIWTVFFSTLEVIAYNFNGVEQFRWGSALLAGAQGMELVGSELAVFSSSTVTIEFFDPVTGAPIRNIPGAAPTVEGLAYDGSTLWQLDTPNINGINPANGAPISTIPNAATGCSFGGTGITASAPGQLTLACSNGSWFVVSSADGSVLDSGNNTLDMYGLKRGGQLNFEIPTLSPAGLIAAVLVLLFAGLLWRRSAA